MGSRMDELLPDPTQDMGGEAMPGAQPAPVKDPLDDDAFAASVRTLIEAARAHMDDDVRPAVERGWKYYGGEVDAAPANAMLDENGQVLYEGSRVVIRECWDRTQQMLPEIARVFLASDEAVSYVPQTEEDEKNAEQATDYANYVWKVLNDGENLLMDGVIDWAVKFAAFKYYWEVDKRTATHPFAGIDQAALQLLQMEAQASPDVVELVANPRQIMLEQLVPTPDGAFTRQLAPDVVFDGHLKRVAEDKSHICIEGIPHDEFLIDPYCQSAETALFVGSDCYRTISDIVAMGVDLEDALEYKTNAPDARSTDHWGRRPQASQTAQPLTEDSSLDYVRVVEGVVQLDRDGDGIAERYRVLCLGDNFKLYDAQATDDCGYVVGSPFRTPHDPIGKGIVEQNTDLQDIKTSLVRDSLNNFRRANHPREVVSTADEAAYSDVKSWFSGVIRADDPANLGFHVIPYVGDKAFSYLEYFDAIGARRTGISDAGMGLDPDIMKGQTAEGAHIVAAGPQVRMEYLVREFAIQIMRPLFLGILRLSAKYQDKPAVVRLRNKWVTVDPRGWNAAMDAQPRVGLGTGTRPERMQGLMVLLAKQEQLMAMQSPLVDVHGYRQSLTELCELLGRKDSVRYFKDPTDQELAQHAQQQQAAADQAAQKAAALQAQVEGAKAQASAQARAQADVAKIQADAQLAQHKASLDAQLQERTHAATLQAQREEMVMKLEIQREEMQQKYALEMAVLAQQKELKLFELREEARLEELRMERGAASGDGNIRQVAN